MFFKRGSPSKITLKASMLFVHFVLVLLVALLFRVLVLVILVVVVVVVVVVVTARQRDLDQWPALFVWKDARAEKPTGAAGKKIGTMGSKVMRALLKADM